MELPEFESSSVESIADGFELSYEATNNLHKVSIKATTLPNETGQKLTWLMHTIANESGGPVLLIRDPSSVLTISNRGDIDAGLSTRAFGTFQIMIESEQSIKLKDVPIEAAKELKLVIDGKSFDLTKAFNSVTKGDDAVHIPLSAYKSNIMTSEDDLGLTFKVKTETPKVGTTWKYSISAVAVTGCDSDESILLFKDTKGYRLFNKTETDVQLTRSSLIYLIPSGSGVSISELNFKNAKEFKIKIGLLEIALDSSVQKIESLK